MGIQVGGIDLAESSINNELRIGILEKSLQHIMRQLSSSGAVQMTQADIDRFREESTDELKKKYPKAGLVAKE